MEIIARIKDWTRELPREIRETLLAMAMRESALDPWAVRFESGYQWPWQVKENSRELNISFATELQLQSFSYGLLQVMGGTARWQGFKGPLMSLCWAERVAFDHGVRYFLYQMERYNNDIAKALCAYNAGNVKLTDDGKFQNQAYVDAIFEFRRQLSKHWEMSA
jgi:hypothetical protein